MYKLRPKMLLHLEWSRLTGFFVFLLVSIIVLNAKSGYAIDTKNVKIEAGLAAIKIRGTVTDEKGLPLPGVTVKVKGTQLVTVTNIKGAFNIQVGDKTSVLLFSYIGFISKEVVVGNNSILNVVLNEAKTSLNEVVVIGYGSVRKRDLTGSVSSVPMEDLQKAPVKSFDEALSGRVAGVAVSGNDGQPGRNSSIVIRGQNSLTQDNSPLYVIDGFPLESSNNNSVNPSDIQSIEILKDASATAIYGARGANGVILITTKSGKVGDPVLSYTGSFGFQQNPKKIDLMSPYEFVKLQYEIDTAKASQFYFKEGRDLDYYRNVKGIDWQDQIYRTAPTQEHNLSLSGGTNKTRYFFSTSLTSQEGVILKTGFDRYQGSLKLTQTINKNLRGFVSVDYSNIKTGGVIPSTGTNSATNNLLYSVWGYRPVSSSDINLTEALFDPEIVTSVDYRVNPVLSAKNELRDATTNNLRINSYAQYTFNKNLNLKVSGGISNNMRRNDTFFNSNTYYGSPFSSTGNGVNGSVIYTQQSSWLNENTLNYSKKFRKVHNLNMVGGITLQGDKYSRYGSSAIQIPNESLGLNGLDEGVPQTVVAENSESKLMSFLGRVNYDYKSKYLMSLSFRADGSSKFAKGKRWSYFPSGSFAWRMSDEPFMQNDFIQEAKLRVGYGVTGNNRVGDFSYLSVMRITSSSHYPFDNAINLGAVPVNLGNPDLRWESTSQANIGYDLSVLKDRITVNADVYRKTTYDLLLDADLPYTTGYTSAFKNIGKVRNDGLEIALYTRNISKKNFKWSTNFNISFNKSKILALNEGQQFRTSSLAWENSFRGVPLYIARVNEPISQFYGFVFDGIYQLDDFNVNSEGGYILKDNIPDNGNSRNVIQPGDVRYKDLNKDNVVNSEDQTVIGRGQPIHVGGLTNNFIYRQFDLSVFLQWSYGNDIYNANRMVFEGNILDKINLNQYANYINRWSPSNPSNTLSRVKGQGPKVYSSRVLEDGSYLRLKTVSLGYNFAPEMLKAIKLKNLRLSASAQNLLTFTNYSGMDPEVSVRNSALTPGFDYSAYPRAKTVVFTLNASL